MRIKEYVHIYTYVYVCIGCIILCTYIYNITNRNLQVPYASELYENIYHIHIPMYL